MNPMISVACVRLRAGARLPERKSLLAAGADLCACLEVPRRLLPGERALIPTGLALALPEGYEGQVRPRSGLALAHGVTVLNSPGTIDADYRGEVQVLLVNLGQAEYVVEDGMRVAQLVVAPVQSVSWLEVESLDPTARGASGFGSTG